MGRSGWSGSLVILLIITLLLPECRMRDTARDYHNESAALCPSVVPASTFRMDGQHRCNEQLAADVAPARRAGTDSDSGIYRRSEGNRDTRIQEE